MPVKTVVNWSNWEPLCHVGVMSKTTKLTCKKITPGCEQSQRYPTFMANVAGLLCRALEKFFLFWARNPSKKLAAKMKVYICKAHIYFWVEKQSLWLIRTLFNFSVLRFQCLCSPVPMVSSPSLSFWKLWKLKMLSSGCNVPKSK